MNGIITSARILFVAASPVVDLNIEDVVAVRCFR